MPAGIAAPVCKGLTDNSGYAAAMVSIKCRRCTDPAVERGLCAKHLQTPEYIDPRREPRKRTPRRKRYTLASDPRWRELAKKFRAANPWCARCANPAEGARPKQTPVEHVDHIRPAGRFPELRYEWDNLQSLCRPCHSRKSIHESRGKCYDYARRIVYRLPKWT